LAKICEVDTLVFGVNVGIWDLTKWVKFIRFRKGENGFTYATIQMRVPMYVGVLPKLKGKRTIAYFAFDRQTGRIYIDDYEYDGKKEEA